MVFLRKQNTSRYIINRFTVLRSKGQLVFDESIQYIILPYRHFTGRQRHIYYDSLETIRITGLIVPIIIYLSRQHKAVRINHWCILERKIPRRLAIRSSVNSGVLMVGAVRVVMSSCATDKDRATSEHVFTYINRRCVPSFTYINSGKIRTLIEHIPHIRHVRRIEIAQVKRSQTRTVLEHTSHEIQA